ncbi:MAG: flavin reductase family protein [Lachnospira sp.]
MGKQNWKPGNMLYPVPAVMVSCKRPGEKSNIITVAWAGTICSDPVKVSVSVRKERFSHDIIKDTGEFVINLTNRKLCFATDFCGVKSGRDIDKFKELHLTEEKCEHVSAPAIKESPINLECVVEQVMELGSHDMFIARVVGVRVDENLLDNKGTLHLDNADLIAYSHGAYYGLGDCIGRFGYSVRKKK